MDFKREMVTRDMRVTSMKTTVRYDSHGSVRVDNVAIQFTDAYKIAGYGKNQELDFLEVYMTPEEALFIRPNGVYRVDIREVDAGE